MAGPIFTVVGLAGLAACVIWGPGVRGATLVVVVAAAMWVPLLIPLFPHRRTHPGSPPATTPGCSRPRPCW